MVITFDIFFILFFLVWAIISLIAQCKPQMFADYNMHLLIPNWRFFGPIPLKVDYILLYRDQLSNGCLTSFHEITPDINRTFKNFFWNPSFYKRKAYTDICMELNYVYSFLPNKRLNTTSYNCMVNYIFKHPHHPDAISTQFILLIINPKWGKAKFCLSSDFHRLP